MRNENWSKMPVFYDPELFTVWHFKPPLRLIVENKNNENSSLQIWFKKQNPKKPKQ